MKIIGIGMNYAEHTKELKNEVPEKPVFFLKADSCIVKKNKPFFLPGFSNEIHHEIEIVVEISKLGKGIEPQFAHRYYDRIGIGIDFTARDLQREYRAKGLPWAICKSFDYSAPISKFIGKEKFANIQKIDFSLEINGEIRQKGNTSDMVFTVDHLISYLSQFMTLKTGDLIFTGTPAGVGQVFKNDHLKGYLGDEMLLDFLVK